MCTVDHYNRETNLGRERNVRANLRLYADQVNGWNSDDDFCVRRKISTIIHNLDNCVSLTQSYITFPVKIDKLNEIVTSVKFISPISANEDFLGT